MKICRLNIKDFRGVKSATILLPKHAVLIGDNNTGKTTLLEALDLALGPDRLNRQPPIDEHDFFQGKYLARGTGRTDRGSIVFPAISLLIEGPQIVQRIEEVPAAGSS